MCPRQVKSFAAEEKEAARYSGRLEATQALSAGGVGWVSLCIRSIRSGVFPFLASRLHMQIHRHHHHHDRGRAEERRDGGVLAFGHLLQHLHCLGPRRAAGAGGANDGRRPRLLHRLLLQVRLSVCALFATAWALIDCYKILSPTTAHSLNFAIQGINYSYADLKRGETLLSHVMGVLDAAPAAPSSGDSRKGSYVNPGAIRCVGVYCVCVL